MDQAGENERLRRQQPYILRVANSLFVIVDGRGVIVKPNTMSVALDTLMKAFFVFNLAYPPQTRVVHKLLEHVVLRLDEGNVMKLSTKALKLVSELALE